MSPLFAFLRIAEGEAAQEDTVTLVTVRVPAQEIRKVAFRKFLSETFLSDFLELSTITITNENTSERFGGGHAFNF